MFKSVLKRLLKSLLWAAIGIGSLIVAYLLLAGILSLLGTKPEPVDCPDKQRIYITTNGLHLNFILPVETMEAELLAQLQPPAQVDYLSFGWGDKIFYLETPTWAELRSGPSLRALVWKTDAAMHVVRYTQCSDSWRKLDLCPSQYEQLSHYILQSFQQGKQGRFIKIPDAGYTYRDAFYEAKGHYSALRTCNNWVNVGLKKAKVKTSVWSPFDFGVLHHLPK